MSVRWLRHLLLLGRGVVRVVAVSMDEVAVSGRMGARIRTIRSGGVGRRKSLH